MADEPVPITTVKARGGVTPHIVRYVLMISVALAVAAMIFVYLQSPKGDSSAPAATTATR